MKTISICVLMFFANSAIGSALTLSAGGPDDFLNATDCIFGGNGNGGCPLIVGADAAPAATPSGSPGQSYSGTSYTYTVDELIGYLNGDNLFNVVIDTNWSSGGGHNQDYDSEFLNLFEVLINGVVEFDYDGGAPLDFGANGNGKENWLLSTVDLAGFDLTDEVTFTLQMSDLTGGFEQVALLAAGTSSLCSTNPTGPGCNFTTVMPEPGILLLISAGLLGMAIGRRRFVSR